MYTKEIKWLSLSKIKKQKVGKPDETRPSLVSVGPYTHIYECEWKENLFKNQVEMVRGKFIF